MISYVITIFIIVVTIIIIITIIIMITLFCSETLHFALARIRITPACPYLKLTFCQTLGVDYDLVHGVDDDVGDGYCDSGDNVGCWCHALCSYLLIRRSG